MMLPITLLALAIAFVPSGGALTPELPAAQEVARPALEQLGGRVVIGSAGPGLATKTNLNTHKTMKTDK